MKMSLTFEPKMAALQEAQEKLDKAITTMTANVKKSEKSLANAEKRAQELAEALKASGQPTQKMANDLEKANAKVTVLAEQVRRERAELEGAQKAAQGNAEKMDHLARAAKDAASGAASIAKGGKDAAKGLDSAAQSAGGLASKLGGLAELALGAIGISGIGGIVSLIDQYGQMASRIKMVSDSTAEYEEIQARLAETASNTYRPLAEAQEMYIRTADSLKSLGYNTKTALDVTDSLSYLMVTNAASGERATNTITAFARAMEKGKMQAQDWQIIMSAVPSIVEDIAAASGKTTEEVRRLGAMGDGMLPLMDILEGLRLSLDKNREAAEKMPTTVADAFTKLKTNLQIYLGTANEATGVTDKFVKLLSFLSENAGIVANVGIGALVLAVGALALKVGHAAKSFVAMQWDSIKSARAQRELEQALLATARAEVIAAQAAVAQAKINLRCAQSAIDRAAAQHQLTVANARLAASEGALTKASAATAASKAGFGAILGRLAGVFMGPWSIAIGAAVGLLSSFASETAVAAQSQLDLAESLDKTIEKFNQLSEAQKGAEIAAQNKIKEDALGAYRSARRELESMAKSESGVWSDWWKGFSDPAKAANKELWAALKKGSTDFAAMSKALDQATGIDPATRREMAALLAEMEKQYLLIGKTTEALGAMAKAKEDAGKDNEKPVESLSRALTNAREAAKALGVDLSKFSSKVSPEFEEVEKHLDVLVERFDKLKEGGIDMGAALQDALVKSLEKAKNPADLNALVDRVAKLGEAGTLAKPKMIELFNAIKEKARDAGGEAKALKDEIDKLLAKAESVRRGQSGYGAKAAEARRAGMSPEAQEAEAIRTAQNAAQDARFYAVAARAAQLDGRTDVALKHAERAKKAMEEADAAASRMSDKASAAKIYDDLAQSEQDLYEAEAKAKQAQLDKMKAATAAQEKQIAELEKRIDGLIGKANGVPLVIETGQAHGALDAVKKDMESLKDKVVTVTVNTVRTGAGEAGNVPAFARGGTLPGYSPTDTADNLLFMGTAGEEVIRRAIAKQPRAREFLKLFNQIGMAAVPLWSKRLPAYANGGTLAAASRQPDRMVSAVFNIPGVGSVPAQVSKGVATDLARTLKIEALMRGKRG